MILVTEHGEEIYNWRVGKGNKKLGYHQCFCSINYFKIALVIYFLQGTQGIN